MAIIICQNLHRARLLEPTSGNMSADVTSDIIDFRDTLTGSIQAKWSGNDALDGELYVEASNVPEDDWFDEITDGFKLMNDDGTKGKRKNQIFNLCSFGFRYARVKYYHNSNTTGTLEIIALGKKGG